MRRCLW